MDVDWIVKWFTGKVAVADGIVKVYGETATTDAEILLCCATSALAAKMWPGPRKDKRRLVQFMVDFAPSALKVTRISIPILIAKMKRHNRSAVADAIVRQFYAFPQLEILDGDRVDRDERSVLNAVSNLSITDVRVASYAGIIYSDLRSGLVHEYSLAPFMHTWGMSPRDDVPTYVNFGIAPDPATVTHFAARYKIALQDAEQALVKRERHIYFPYAYLRSVLTEAANGAFEYWRKSAVFEKSIPNPWWIG